MGEVERIWEGWRGYERGGEDMREVERIWER